MTTYQTVATNTGGVQNGRVTFSDHSPLLTQDPLDTGEGMNPEQLIGAAWATCLNATIQSILKTNQEERLSTVSVTVSQEKETGGKGLYFKLVAQASIKDLPLDQVERITRSAHRYCPISKLIQQSPTISLQVVPWQEEEPIS